jgi:pectin methylesterase-like acyl-CoA thioesterase
MRSNFSKNKHKKRYSSAALAAPASAASALYGFFQLNSRWDFLKSSSSQHFLKVFEAEGRAQ